MRLKEVRMNTGEKCCINNTFLKSTQSGWRSSCRSVHMVSFPTPIYFPFQPRGRLAAGGRWAVLALSSGDKLPRFNLYTSRINHPQHLRTTSPMQSGYTTWGRAKRQKKHSGKERRFVQVSQQLSRVSLRSCSCGTRCRAVWKEAVHHPRTQSAACMAGELMGTSTRNTI